MFMGLISTEVEVNLCSQMIKYYEGLGYKIPRRKDTRGQMTVPRGIKIKVKVKDLPKSSNTKVTVKCENCKKEYQMCYSVYNMQNHNGEIYCKSCEKKIFNSGTKHHNWNPNKTEEERINGRRYPKYNNFVKKVLARDNYTCQVCGQEHGDLEVHHLDGYDWCKEKRTYETNGITLCKNCHSNFHSIYGYGNNTKEQFEEWYGQAVELLKYEGTLSTARKVYCVEENKIYDSVKQIEKEYGCSNSAIYSICNRKGRNKSFKGKHFLWLDEYKKMSKEELKKYLEWCEPKDKTKIVCTTTRKIFNSVEEAKRYYGINAHISECCRGIIKSSGKLPDGTKLQWKYIEDLTKEEYIEYDIENKLKEV